MKNKIMNILLLFLITAMLSLPIGQTGCNTNEPNNDENKITSHDFTWQMYTIGTGGATSDLNDASIIDENNIWAVGEFYIKDSLDQIDYEPYGTVNWDGAKWNCNKLKVLNPSNYYSFLVPQAIIAFSKDDIWIVSGGVFHFDGKKVTKSYWINYAGGGNPYAIFGEGQELNRIWGVATNNLYVAGNKGALAHFDGTTWKKIETGTNLDILDIWGNNKNTNNIIVVAGKDYENFSKEVYLINGTSIRKIISNEELFFIRSLWFDDNYKATLVGTSIYNVDNILTNSSIKEIQVDRVHYALNSIRGNGGNDLFIAGAYGEILHYNGENWKSYIDQTHINGNYYKISVKGDLVVAVGLDNPNAIIAVGMRHK